MNELVFVGQMNNMQNMREVDTFKNCKQGILNSFFKLFKDVQFDL